MIADGGIVQWELWMGLCWPTLTLEWKVRLSAVYGGLSPPQQTPTHTHPSLSGTTEGLLFCVNN